MEAPLIATKNLYLQKTFATNSAQWIKSLLGAAADETLLCAVWISPILRYGFVISDKAVRWRLPADEKPVTGFVLKQLSPQAEFRIHEEGSMLRLEIASADTTFSFFFSALAIEKGTTLCDILRYGFAQGTVPQTDLGVLVKNMPFVAVRNVFDGVLNKLVALSEKLKHKPKQKAESAKAAADTNEETAKPVSDEPPANAAESYKKRRRKALKEKAAFVVLSFIDVLASLLFIAAVVIAIKPELLPFANYKFCEDSIFAEAFSWKGEYFKLIAIYRPGVNEAALLVWRNLLITAALVLFSLFKLFVALHSKNSGRKIVSVLMIAMSILACSLVADKFLIFIAFCLLIYISFEYSCGLRTKIVFTKLLTVVELAVIGYIVAHIVLDAECRLHLSEAIIRFALPVGRWL